MNTVKGFAGLGQDLGPVKNSLVLERLKTDPERTQCGFNRRIARLGPGLVIAIGKYCHYAELTGQSRNFAVRPGMADNQAAAAPAQGCIEFDQRLANEFDAPVACARQGVKNLAIKDKHTENMSRPS